ncbi:MAG TPA: S53 family peptidase [Candidatus Acidoferrales bacterium]
MRRKSIVIGAFAIVLLSALVLVPRGSSQSSAARLITQSIDESKMVTLTGNTHPFARAEFDQGPVSASMPMNRLMLVLKRSPAQEAALDTFLAQQLDPKSANYHNWLTPDQFGERFGASEDDATTLTTWLQSRGFQVAGVSHGRNIIEFSGNAGQIQAALHTAIHSYLVNGQQRWANQSDPQIPAALAPAVYGFVSLNNFPKQPASHSLGAFRKSLTTGKVERVPSPSYTFQGGCESNNDCYALGPQDIATIYNITPLYNAGIDGTGETIAVVADSDINTTDVSQFRSVFGLPANTPNIIHNGTDPGKNGDEVEAVLDTEWSGGIARKATIDLVVSENVDLSATYIIDNNIAPIMSESFGECELFLGAAGNAFYTTMYKEAVGQGQTVIISTGDSGSVGCLSGMNSSAANTYGLGVSGLASTQYNVAVGGTDFNDINNQSAYWNSTNTSGTNGSAKGYIPETTWNDSCTNAALADFGYSTNAETNCNNSAVSNTLANDVLNGGSGGVSNCTTPTGSGTATSQCAGGNAKPSWQTGAGVPSDNHRYVPDVSLFASTGFLTGSFYVVCQLDNTMGQDGTPCNLSANAFAFGGAGGTSVSTQVFAGIMALIDQKAGGRQGNINPMFYTLANNQAGKCASGSPASNCDFYDVSAGTISQPCMNASGSSNCTVNTNTDSFGVVVPYSAAAGYDPATGLGSVNVTNLATAIGGNIAPVGSFTVGPSSGTATVSAPGSSATYDLTVTGTNGFAGTVNFSCTGLPEKAFCSAPAATLSASTTTASSTLTITTTAATAQLVPNVAPGNNGPAQRSAPLLDAKMFSAEMKRALPISLAMLLLLGAAAFFYLPRSRQRISASTLPSGVAFAVLILGLVFIASCGGGGGGTTTGTTGTPTGTSTVTVTATSGTTTSSTTFTLTVN